MIKVVGFLVISACAGSALACDNGGTPLTTSKADAPRAAVVWDDAPLAQPFSFKIEFCDDVTVQDINVDAMMPAHKHGMNYSPTVVDLGGGVFQADGMLFHMPGVWEVRIDLMHDRGSASYIHTVTLQ